jgi:hypothetical protein
MADSTGRSLRYFNVAHIRLRDSGTMAHSSGEGMLAEPRVTEEMKPFLNHELYGHKRRMSAPIYLLVRGW